jgi:hypothetical protein
LLRLLELDPNRGIFCVVHFVCALHQLLVIIGLFFLILRERVNFRIPTQMFILKVIPILLFLSYFRLSLNPIQYWPLLIMQPDLIGLFGQLKQYLFPFRRYMHQLQRILNQPKLYLIIQRRICGKRRRMVDLNQLRLLLMI